MTTMATALVLGHAQAHTSLVASNWVRTVAWTLRAAIAAAMLARLLQTR